MRFDDAKDREWHRWYAWYPKTLIHPKTGVEITFWLEHIWRKKVNGAMDMSMWVYSGEDPNKDEK